MNGYIITAYTQAQARKLGVTVKHSKTHGKKLDVFKNGEKVATIGAIGYADYPTFMRLERQGKVATGTAVRRRKAYKMRHEKDRHIRNSNGWYADKLLW
jgi:hypothetical protein